MLLDISNCVPFVLSWRNEMLTIVLFSVTWQQFLLFKKRARNGPELWERRGYVSNHLHDRCCAMSPWEMLCVCVVTCERVHSCAKKTQKAKCEKAKSTWSILRSSNQLFLKFANNYSFIYLYKSLSGFSWRKCSFVLGKICLFRATVFYQ